MAEWPKRISDIARYSASEGHMIGLGEPIRGSDDFPYTRDDTEVIPADLGRELYETLRSIAEGEWGPKGNREAAIIACGRYEREVGNG
jgi:hypothetical protein